MCVWRKAEGERKKERDRENKKGKERKRKSEAGCRRERKRMENGWLRRRVDRAGNFWERLTTSRLKEDTHTHFRLCWATCFVHVPYLTLALQGRIFYQRARLCIYSTRNNSIINTTFTKKKKKTLREDWMRTIVRLSLNNGN